MHWNETDLWNRSLGLDAGSNSERSAIEELRTAYRNFRARAEILAAQIEADVPSLTDHSVKHLDALWDISSTLAKGVPFNPLEAFVFGGAVLLHDLANSVAAFPNGSDGLRGPEWDDLVHAHFRRNLDRAPSPEELRQPPRSLPEPLLQRLREIHAAQAVSLATEPLNRTQAAAGQVEPIYLLDNQRLREELGHLIGRIAHSHHWPAAKVEDEFAGQVHPAPSGYPDWKVDVLKVALLLRLADAAQIDSRRAPTFALAIRRPTGTSYLHWNFQNKLKRPVVQSGYLVYHSAKPFRVEDAESWWLCLDALRMIHNELAAADEILSRCRPEFRFAAHGVVGHDSPEVVLRTVEVEGWTPRRARIGIKDALGVIKKFGGEHLYGNDPGVALRELLANAADAIRARRVLEAELPPDWGKITVTLGRDIDDAYWLEVADDGVGMSEALLSGPLLEFGTSYWETWLAREEHPGLLSRGFEPTGKFGIGFFSAFMLGDRIRVVSRAAPRFGVDESQILALEFRDPNSTNALIRPAKPEEWFPEPGTRVRIWLRRHPTESQGFLSRQRNSEWNLGATIARLVERASSSSKGFDALGELLSRLIEVTTPTLDVTVASRIAVPGEEEDSRVVVQANDWLTIPFGQLLERIEDAYFPGRDVLVDSDAVLRTADRPVARLAVSRAQAPKAAITIGGFATGSWLRCFPGILIGHSPNLTRTSGRPWLDAKTLREWLQRAEGRLAEACTDFGQGSWYASLFLEFEVRPKKIPCFLFHRNVLHFDGMADAELPATVSIVLPEKFDWTLPNGNIQRVSFDDAARSEQLLLRPGIIVAPVIETSLHADDREGWPRWGREVLPTFHTLDGQPFPWTLPLLAVEAVAQNWGIDPLELVGRGRELMPRFGIQIGTYAKAPLKTVVLTLRRPRNLTKSRS